ncbi:MAG: DUF2007 domain-containing protein [candidate division Zixibacteria bacterium]|nr:DUF2007 domain-containing protein [candidate division Zixibacteria bacterium]
MPFCPKCKYEYKIGVARCPDCGSDLVEKLAEEPAKATDNDVRAVLLLKTDDRIYAQLMASVLEEAEIPFWSKRLDGGFGYGVSGAITHLSYDSTGAAEIYVHPDDLTRAQELMDAFLSEDDQA